jgi:hypothetical protein
MEGRVMNRLESTIEDCVAAAASWRNRSATSGTDANGLVAEVDRLRAELAECRAAREAAPTALAARIVGALCWGSIFDDPTEDSRSIARRYGELKGRLSFDAADRMAKLEFGGRAGRCHRPTARAAAQEGHADG